MSIKKISENNWVVVSISGSVFSGKTRAEALERWRDSLVF